MIANILTEMSQAVPTTDVTQEFNLIEKMFEHSHNDVVVTMVEGDSARFAAGFMYAYTKQLEDHQQYLVDCSVQVNQLDVRLTREMKRYGNENYPGGNHALINAEPNWRDSMAACTET